MYFGTKILNKLMKMTDDEKTEFVAENAFMSMGAAKYLGISKATIIRWHGRGKLKPDFVLEEGYRFYFKWSLDKFLDNNNNKNMRKVKKQRV